jgi:hypothetical protein
MKMIINIHIVATWKSLPLKSSAGIIGPRIFVSEILAEVRSVLISRGNIWTSGDNIKERYLHAVATFDRHSCVRACVLWAYGEKHIEC